MVRLTPNHHDDLLRTSKFLVLEDSRIVWKLLVVVNYHQIGDFFFEGYPLRDTSTFGLECFATTV